MHNFSIETIDISEGHYVICQKDTLTSYFIKKTFGTFIGNRNIEQCIRNHQASGNPPIQIPAVFNSFYNSCNYRDGLLRHLVTEPYSQKELVPNLVKLLNGETVTLKGSKIHISTTNMNYTKLDDMLIAYLKLFDFPKLFLNRPAKIEIDFSSIHIENFEKCSFKRVLVDDFERNSECYRFDLEFNLLVTLETPIKPRTSLKKYAHSMKGVDSDDYIQILCDALHYPGKFSYSAPNGKIYLKPQNFDEAKDFFCKRFMRSRKLRLQDVFELTDQSITKRQLDGACRVYDTSTKKATRNSALLHIVLNTFLNNSDFKYRLKRLINCFSELNTAIDNFNLYGKFDELFPIVQKINDTNLGFDSIVYINPRLFTDYLDLYFTETRDIIKDLTESLVNVGNIVDVDSLENHSQSAVIKYLCERICIDPISYIENEDEIISDFAHILLNGL